MTDDQAQEPQRCPRCGHWIPDNKQPGAFPGALSRHYGSTGAARYRGPEVCSPCGAEEAMLAFKGVDLSQEVWPIQVREGTR